jgi:hypothetical protein
VENGGTGRFVRGDAELERGYTAWFSRRCRICPVVASRIRGSEAAPLRRTTNLEVVDDGVCRPTDFRRTLGRILTWVLQAAAWTPLAWLLTCGGFVLFLRAVHGVWPESRSVSSKDGQIVVTDATIDVDAYGMVATTILMGAPIVLVSPAIVALAALARRVCVKSWHRLSAEWIVFSIGYAVFAMGLFGPWDGLRRIMDWMLD